MLSTMLNSTFVYAETDNKACNYSRNFINKVEISDKSIRSQTSLNSVDPDSDEYVTTQYLLYKSGDLAVIEHKFCSMYNYELVYFVADGNFKTTAGNIGKLINKIFLQTAAIKPDFNESIAIAIEKKLKKSKFTSSKAFSQGLEISNNGNINIEQSINYIKLKHYTSLYQSMISYYLGVGGADL